MPKLLPHEIEGRAASIGSPYLSMAETAWIAGISRQALWRMSEEEKPEYWRAGGTPVVVKDIAVEWALKHNAKRGG